MPLARYFLFVGGALLALLFLVDACLPELPVAERTDSHLATIRIHSEQKWPQRIVYDTSIPTIVPAPETARADISPSTAVADVSTKARQAFAQLQRSDANEFQRSDQRKREPKPQRQRKIAKRNGPPPTLLVARQPQFGWFGPRIW
jgi:hypothetical protein